MPWSKTTWANAIATHTTSTEVAPSGSVSANIDTHGANKYITLAVRVSVLFDTAPNKAAEIGFYGYNADGPDTDVDTLALYAAEIPQRTTSEEIATYQLNVAALDQVQVLVTNLDSTKSVWVHVSYMAGYQ